MQHVQQHLSSTGRIHPFWEAMDIFIHLCFYIETTRRASLLHHKLCSVFIQTWSFHSASHSFTVFSFIQESLRCWCLYYFLSFSCSVLLHREIHTSGSVLQPSLCALLFFFFYDKKKCLYVFKASQLSGFFLVCFDLQQMHHCVAVHFL